MPSLELFVAPPPRFVPQHGNLVLDPPISGLSRVLVRNLYCSLRVPPIPGVYDAILDTGAPLTIFPRSLWDYQFRWQAGRNYDELSVAGIGTTLRGQVLGYSYSFRLARLRVPVELAGRDPKVTGCASTRSSASSRKVGCRLPFLGFGVGRSPVGNWPWNLSPVRTTCPPDWSSNPRTDCSP